MEIASKALTGVNALRQIINSERIYHTDHSTYNPSSTGTVTHVTQISQGDGNFGNRTGNSILVKSLQFNMSLSRNASATAATLVRVMFFTDLRQVADTAPSISDILVTTSTVALKNSQATLSGRFKVIYDQTFCLDTSQGITKTDKAYFDLNQHVMFNGSATSDIDKGGIYMLTLSNEATNTPTLVVSYRISYYDN